MDFLKDFGVKPILLAAQVVNFFILLFLLKKFLYGPILKVLETRKKTIETSLKNAEEIERKLAETEDEAEKILAKTLQESKNILDETNAAALQILEDARQQAAEILNKAYAKSLEITKAEKVKLQQEIRENAAGLVALVFEKVTGRKVTGKDQMKIIEKEVKNLS